MTEETAGTSEATTLPPAPSAPEQMPDWFHRFWDDATGWIGSHILHLHGRLDAAGIAGTLDEDAKAALERGTKAVHDAVTGVEQVATEAAADSTKVEGEVKADAEQVVGDAVAGHESEALHAAEGDASTVAHEVEGDAKQVEGDAVAAGEKVVGDAEGKS